MIRFWLVVGVEAVLTILLSAALDARKDDMAYLAFGWAAWSMASIFFALQGQIDAIDSRLR